MNKSEKRRYTREFCTEAVKLVLEQGMTLEPAGAYVKDLCTCKLVGYAMVERMTQ